MPLCALRRVHSGSDLRIYRGRTAAQPGLVMGHEAEGIVEETGRAVRQITVGDRVVMPLNVACGQCFNCLRGFANACLALNPAMPGAMYGYPNMGGWQGAQAEYLRVPHADFNAMRLPGSPGEQVLQALKEYRGSGGCGGGRPVGRPPPQPPEPPFISPAGAAAGRRAGAAAAVHG